MPSATVQASQPSLPKFQPDELVLDANGAVTRHVSWTCWNGENWPTIDIARQADGSFVGHLSDPEHGGGSSRGTFEKATEGLHPEIVAEYRALFALVNPTARDIAAIGFRSDVTITRQPAV